MVPQKIRIEKFAAQATLYRRRYATALSGFFGALTVMTIAFVDPFKIRQEQISVDGFVKTAVLAVMLLFIVETLARIFASLRVNSHLVKYIDIDAIKRDAKQSDD